MDVAGVITRVKRQFGDESSVQITDDDIIRWINDAQDHIASTNEDLLQETSLVNLVAGQQDYPLPTDLLTLSSVSIKTATMTSFVQIKGLPIQQFNELVNGWDGNYFGTGTSYAYTSYKSSIRLLPIPAENVTNGLKFFYNRLPVEVASPVGTLDLPRSYHNAIVNFCLQQAYELDENFQASTAKGEQLASQIHNNKFNDEKNSREFYSTITTLQEDLY